MVDGARRMLQILGWILFSDENILKDIDSKIEQKIKDSINNEQVLNENENDDMESFQNQKNIKIGNPKKLKNIFCDFSEAKNLHEAKLLVAKKKLMVQNLLKMRSDKMKQFQVSNTNNKNDLSYLRNLKSDDHYRHILETKEGALKKLNSLHKQSKHRKQLAEWISHSCVSEKQENPNFENLKDISDFEISEERALGISSLDQVKLIHVYEELLQLLAVMKQKSSLIKAYSNFWEAASEKLKSSQFFRKKMKMVIPQVDIQIKEELKQPHTINFDQEKQFQVDMIGLFFDMLKSAQESKSTIHSQEEVLDEKQIDTMIKQKLDTVESVQKKWKMICNRIKIFFEGEGISMVTGHNS